MPKKPSTIKKTATTTKKAPVAAKKTTSKKSSASEESTTDFDTVGKFVKEALESGDLDFMLVDLDAALTKRINKFNKDAAAAEKKTAGAKSVSSAPKRATASASKPAAKPAAASASKPLTLTAGKRYKVGTKPAALAGGRVTFVEFKPDSDEKKAVVTVWDEKPGYAKGKKCILPVAYLVAAAR